MSQVLAQRAAIDIDEFERRMRAPAPQTGGDPLAELARLVSGGSDAKPDALDAMFARPEARAAAPAPGAEFGDLRGPLGPDAGQAPPIEVHARAESAAPQVETWAEPAADWAPAPEAVARPRSRRPLYAAAAVVAVGLVGVGSTFAYKGRAGGSGELVEVKAQPGPTKVQAQAPADRAGAPADTTLLDRGAAQPPVTRVVDRQEQPVDLAQQATRVRSIPLTGAQPAQPAPEAGSVFAEPPRRVKTVSVRPDGTLSQPAAPPAAVQPPAAAAGATPAAKPPATPKTVARVVAAPKTPDAAPTQPPRAETPKAAAKPAPTRPAPVQARGDDDDAAPAPSGGGFAVQLAAPGTEAEAKAAAARLSKLYGDALGGARISFHKASDKAVYRVRAAGLSKEEAVSACEKVKAAGGNCFVAKN